MATDTQTTVYVVHAPYLPIRERALVGDWQLIPHGELSDEDVTDMQVKEFALGIAKAYAPSTHGRASIGAFCHRLGGKVGDDPEDINHLKDLQRSLVVTVVDVNQSPLTDRNPNAAHSALTADNAVVVAPGIERDGGWTATVSGGRVRSIEGGLKVLPDEEGLIPRMTVARPPDLQIPFIPPALDFEYADAAWESLARESDSARRLARAIDWLDLAWRNTASITNDLRVPAILAGFEVLLNGDDPPFNDVTVEHAARLSALLDDLNATRAKRRWPKRNDGWREDNLTDLQWWFVQFAHLRHLLMHGGRPDEGVWTHEGVPHVDLGEWWLRQAIKRTIVNYGHEDVQLEPLEREVMRASRRALAADCNDR